MKKTILSLSIISSIFLFSCNSENKKPTDSSEVTTTNTTNTTNTSNEETTKVYQVNIEKSKLNWTCGKMMGGSHTGAVTFISGELHGNDAKLVNGKFEIDLKSITNTDITDKAKNADLVGHLKSPDFFDTDKNPTSTLEIISITLVDPAATDANYKIVANLTIKGITKEISFPALIKSNGSEISASAKFTINRKDWGMNYGTEGSVANLAKDRIINNNIDFTVSVTATEVK